jgi:hypothetical protein
VDETLEATVRRLAGGSDLVRTAASVRHDGGVALAVGDAPLRPLFKPEIAQLEAAGNTAEDWSRVRVADGFNPRRVRNCEFRGDVVLGEFKQRAQLADRTEVVAGLSNSTLVDCVIGHNALVRDVRLLANYVVAAGAAVVDCGRVSCAAGATFGNGARVPVALEGGGREVEVFAELDIALATAAARPGARRAELDGYRRAVAEYREAVTSDRGVIAEGARVRGVPRLEDTYVGPGAMVDGATAVCRSTLLSAPDEPVVVESGALVSDSLVQWGCRVTGMAVVEQSVLVEEARVERHGKVRDSVIGPNTEVAAGEVISCLLGPFVGCHHQSLLISTLWPAGRGNVGYGANVGSNHTSRAPDQELWAGEGLFFGLGVNVKFPCDFSRAPYTVIACGVNLPPQKVTFPFSLVAQPKEHFPGVPPVFNQISPGWMLCENVYALKRNEAKFRARNRARRNRFDFSVFRRETVELMRDAARRLAAAAGVKPLYTERDIPGLGKNVLTESDRVRAVEAYRFYTLYYALLGLRQQARDAAAGRGETAGLLDTPGASGEWEYQRGILREAGVEDVAAGLELLAAMAERVAEDCEQARGKDDARGARVIDDYAEVHPPADRDRVVRAAWEEANRLRDEAEEYLRRFPAAAGKGGPAPAQLPHTGLPAAVSR